MNGLKEKILNTIVDSNRKLSQQELEKKFSIKHNVKKKEVRLGIKDLVNTGEIEYISKYGLTFLDISFSRPVSLSRHVIVKPPEIHYSGNENEIVIDIKKGASFGSGRHPTTCLSVKAIEKCLVKNGKIENIAPTNNSLDIGTGSGILAIVSVKLGVSKAFGIDIDERSVFEAEENIKLNKVQDKIEVATENVNSIRNKFDLITANLRYPTLKDIYKNIVNLTEKGSIFIISGIRKNESDKLIRVYSEQYFDCVSTSFLKNWASIIFRRRDV